MSELTAHTGLTSKPEIRPAPAMVASSGLASGRDIRIDFFRGIALIMIFINHLPATPWSIVTLRAWGFSDSAEVFVLLAGLSSALAYGRYFKTWSVIPGISAVFKRIRALYVTHVMLIIVIGAMCIFASARLGENSYIETLGFEAFLTSPIETVTSALTLTFLPGYLDILPLYIVLLATVPLLFLLAKGHWSLPLLASITLYITAQFYPLNLPNQRVLGDWFFNPAAWQLLFVIGFTIGRRMQVTDGFAWQLSAKIAIPLTFLALGISVLTVLMVAPWQHIPGYEALILIEPALLGSWSKSDLPLIRLTDILLKFWLVTVLIKADARWLQGTPARLVAQMGKHSLEVFALSTMLAVAGGIVITIAEFEPFLVAITLLSGVATMMMLASGMEWRGKRHVRPSIISSLPGQDRHHPHGA